VSQKIYTNGGNGNYGEIGPGTLEGIASGSTILGDIDNDGDLDLIITGQDSAAVRISKIYRNNGSASFTEIGGGSLENVYLSATSLGDIDSDGDLDLILTGLNTGGAYTSKIYSNNGSGGFVETGAGSIIGVAFSSIVLGDIDRDGDLDLVLTGASGPFADVSKIYTNNNGSGIMVEKDPGSLDGMYFSGISMGDIDDDGDLDLLMAGDTTGSGSRVSRIYTNSGTGNFGETGMGSLQIMRDSSVSLGDIDQDGDLDLVLIGNSTGPLTLHALVYTNNGMGQYNAFFSDTNILIPVSHGSSMLVGHRR